MKSHFEDEERLRRRRENSGKDLGQIHLFEVSLRGERLRNQRETSGKIHIY